ncbi:hypothetical protein [Mesorhizobium delmotii]|nr:hypothetical protein [Mesorhizobium delmotii]
MLRWFSTLPETPRLELDLIDVAVSVNLYGLLKDAPLADLSTSKRERLV